jgi:hypothetical protein
MISVASSGVMRPCSTAACTSEINAGSSWQEQVGSMLQKGWSSVWMMGSSIRTIRGGCCRCHAMVVTVLSVLLEHLFGLTAGSMAHILCGENRASTSTVTTVLKAGIASDHVMPANALQNYTPSQVLRRFSTTTRSYLVQASDTSQNHPRTYSIPTTRYNENINVIMRLYMIITVCVKVSTRLLFEKSTSCLKRANMLT